MPQVIHPEVKHISFDTVSGVISIRSFRTPRIPP